MKSLLRAFSAILILLAVIFFLFASNKFVEAEKQGDALILLEEAEGGNPAIITKQKPPEEQLASLGFNASLICGTIGVLLFFIARGVKSKPE